MVLLQFYAFQCDFKVDFLIKIFEFSRQKSAIESSKSLNSSYSLISDSNKSMSDVLEEFKDGGSLNHYNPDGVSF